MRKIWLLVFMLILGISTLPQGTNPVDHSIIVHPDQIYEGYPKSNFSLGSVPLQLDFDLNVIFIGFNNTIVDESSILSQVPQWYAPINRFENHFNVFENPFIPLTFDVNYTINYNFQYTISQDLQDYKDFIVAEGDLHSTASAFAYFDELDPSLDQGYYVPSHKMEDYLATKYFDGQTPTIVIIDAYSDNPQAFNPHFFNNSFADFDHPQSGTAREYGSEQNLAGGGGTSQVLFVDFSAGPYFYSNAYGYGGHEHTYFSDLTNSTQVDMVNTNIAEDIQTAIELRFLPSNLYTPITEYNEIKLEFLLIDFQKADQFNSQFIFPIPNVNHDFLTSIDPNHIVTELSAINPHINWTYSTSEYDWVGDEQLKNVILNNINPASSFEGDIDSNAIMEFLDIYFHTLFTPSTEQTTTIPMFLFGMPGLYSTNFGGIANGDEIGSFSYIITAKNVYFAQEKRYSFELHTRSGTLESVTNSEDWNGFYTSFYQNEQFESSMTITGSASANITFEILDNVNFKRWQLSQPYQARFSQTNLKGGDSIGAFNISASDTLDILYWKIGNDNANSATYDLVVNNFKTISSGMTHTSLHEASHALGMSHPHDGFSWKGYTDNQYYCNNQNDTDGFYDWCNGEYAHWLWDQSASYMSYATQPHGMSVLDRIAIQRNIGFQYFQDFKLNYESYIEDIFSRNEYLPEPLIQYVNQSKNFYNAAVSFYETHGYNETINNIFEAQKQLQKAKQLDDREVLNFDLVLTGLDGIAQGEFIDVMVESGPITSSYQFGRDATLSLQFISWTNVTITISYQGTILHQLQTKTWLNADFIIDTSGIPTYIPTTVSVTKTNVNIVTITDGNTITITDGNTITTTDGNTITTTDGNTITTTVFSDKFTSDSESNRGDSPFPASFFIVSIIALPIMRKVTRARLD